MLVNRVVPADVTDPFLAGWRARQQQVAAELDATIGEVPRLRVDLAARERVGVAALGDLADELYGTAVAATVLHKGPRPEVVDRRRACAAPAAARQRARRRGADEL